MRFQPLNKETWPDLQTLFGQKGACGGCWCMYWRLPYKQYEEYKGQKNKEGLYSLIDDGLHLGMLAFSDNQAVAWCSVSPKTQLPRLKTSRLFKNTTEVEGTWSITCLYIHKDYRRKGLSTKIISGATRYAFDNGASMVECYPILPKKAEMPAVFAWVGFVNSFKKAGFEEVVRVSENRCIMRFMG